jgi:hypothetical protein
MQATFGLMPGQELLELRAECHIDDAREGFRSDASSNSP